MPTKPRSPCTYCGQPATNRGRCQRHQRPTTPARGYGDAHQATRTLWAPSVNAGYVNCARCHQPIQPGQPWDLGHTDDRTAYHGPEHARCNRNAPHKTWA